MESIWVVKAKCDRALKSNTYSVSVLFRLGRQQQRSAGRDGGGKRPCRGRPMEEDPTEHLYALGQRAPEDHRPLRSESGDGSIRWPASDRPYRGPVAETHAQV